MKKTDFVYIGYFAEYDNYVFQIKGSSLKELSKLCQSRNIIVVGYDDYDNTSYIYGVGENQYSEELTRILHELCTENNYDTNNHVSLLDVILENKK